MHSAFVAEGVNTLIKPTSEPAGVSEDKGMGVLIITHYQRILDYIKADRVHIPCKRQDL